jgi:hypothetical protein
MLFYALLGAPTNQNITAPEFYYYSNMMLEVSSLCLQCRRVTSTDMVGLTNHAACMCVCVQNYNVYDNVAVYLVDGSAHCFTNGKSYFNAGCALTHSHTHTYVLTHAHTHILRPHYPLIIVYFTLLVCRHVWFQCRQQQHRSHVSQR